MNPIHNILVIVDPTAEEHPAIRKGALLAEKLDARVELFACETKAAIAVRCTDRQVARLRSNAAVLNHREHDLA